MQSYDAPEIQRRPAGSGQPRLVPTFSGPHAQLGRVADELVSRDPRTLEQIAGDAAISLSQLGKLRRGQTGAERVTLDSLAAALGVTAYDHARLLCAAGLLPHLDDPDYA